MQENSEAVRADNTLPSCTNLQSQNQTIFSHFQDHRTQSKKQERKILDVLADFFKLYSFCGFREKWLIVLGSIIGLVSGTAFSTYIFFWAKEADHVINEFPTLYQSTDKSKNYFLIMGGLGVVAWIIDTILFTIWRVISESISHKFRKYYLEHFVQMKVEWIESQNLYEVAQGFKEHCRTIEHAIGDKVALLLNIIGLTIAGVIFSLTPRWTLALFLIGIFPIGAIVLIAFLYVVFKRRQAAVQFYEAANSQASESTNLIKTVKLLGAEEHEQKLYKSHLKEFAEKIRPFPVRLALTTGLFFFIQYFISALAFLFGTQCNRGTSVCPTSVTGSHYSIGQIHNVFTQLFLCVYSYIQLATNLEAISNAIESSKIIYRFIEEGKKMNEGNEKTGLSEEELSARIRSVGAIQMNNLQFAYPSNPDKSILKNITIRLLKNKFNAIVGSTGSGKSTIVQLLLKNYGIQEGSITIDGVNLTEIDAGWFRERIGYVGQEPTIFCGSIRENIRVGKADATDEQIFNVLKKANLYDFTMKLPGCLDYEIGAGGSKLSGGQKQRIAIARALIKNPSLLILDEATSALDRKNEKAIQNTLKSVFKTQQMTVLCIAHRIKTIKDADKIWFLQDGVVKEEGKFENLEYYKDKPIEEDQFEMEQDFQQFNSFNNIIQNQEQIRMVQQEKHQISIYSRLMTYTNSKCSYVIALVASFVCGITHPFGSLILSELYYRESEMFVIGEAYGWQGIDGILDEKFNSTLKFVYAYFGMAFFIFIPIFIQFLLMNRIEDEITHNIREEVFSKLMLMPSEWYDRSENEGGNAASRLGLETQQIGGLLTRYIPNLISNFTTMIGGIAISIAYSWKMGLVSLYVLPAISLGGYMSIIFIGGFDDDNMSLYNSSDKVADELITYIKTIFALNYQTRMVQKYKEKLFQPVSQMMKRGAKLGLFFGFSFFVLFTAIGVSLIAGCNIIANDQGMDKQGAVVCLVVCIWCGWLAGNNFMFIAHSAAGKKSARAVFRFLDAKTEAEQEERTTNFTPISPEKIKGKIEFKNVTFRYRNDYNTKIVLDNVSLVIEAGQKVAIVGESGCGKSTLLQLLQRFYKYQGEILLDGINILDYDLKKYRSYLGVLNQQPSVFSGTLRSNLLFNREATDQEVFESCMLAFCYDINLHKKREISLSENIQQYLQRDVGSKGSKISGGEKQRLACARAVLRKPQIFLMDQGTSALDRDTERQVQENIDRGLKGITSINIAHRIQTIQNSDVIFMLEQGKIVEQGKYDELMSRKRHFYKFVNGSKYTTEKQLTNKLIIKKIKSLPSLDFQE